MRINNIDQAGEIDRRITIERKSITQSDSGEEVVAWVTVATVWAQKIEEIGDERFVPAQQYVGHALRRFRFRWSAAVAAITTEHRILFDGRVFDITDVREVGRRVGIEVKCYAQSEQPVAP